MNFFAALCHVNRFQVPSFKVKSVGNHQLCMILLCRFDHCLAIFHARCDLMAEMAFLPSQPYVTRFAINDGLKPLSDMPDEQRNRQPTRGGNAQRKPRTVPRHEATDQQREDQ
jgi:hypothetical protein